MQPVRVELPHALNNLVGCCETGCDAGCCGINAFDLSPIHAASYLINQRLFFEDSPRSIAEALRKQLMDLDAQHGRDGAQPGAMIPQLGETLDGDGVTSFVQQMLQCISRALLLIEIEEQFETLTTKGWRSRKTD